LAGRFHISGTFPEDYMPDPEPPKRDSEASSSLLTPKEVMDAARLLKLLADPNVLAAALPAIFPSIAEPASSEPDRDSLLSKARLVLGARRIRSQYFHPDLFGEPAWEILLALYVAEEAGPRFTISRLAEWIGAPLTTVARWVKALEEQSLVGRADHPTDRRIIFIHLLDKGRKALDSYLAAIPN
jgi:DNA-binding MarR family transcriptional regulator